MTPFPLPGTCTARHARISRNTDARPREAAPARRRTRARRAAGLADDLPAAEEGRAREQARGNRLGDARPWSLDGQGDLAGRRIDRTGAVARSARARAAHHVEV